jgi:hypothetical protein
MLASTAEFTEAAQDTWRILDDGPNCVGTQTLIAEDDGRVAPTTDPRAPLSPRIVTGRVWFPASCEGKPLQFWQYWGDDLQTAAERFVERVRLVGGDEKRAASAADKTMRTTMAARADASPAQARAPLVMLTGDAGEHALLAEFLAGRGFVVATVAYQGTFVPEFAVSAAELETQVQDLQRALSALRERPFIDPERYALVCHAIGSTSCALLAMRDPRASVFVSLEGGFPSQFEQDLARRSPFFDVAALRVPLLVLHAPHPSIDPRQLDVYRFAPQLRVQLPQTSEYHVLTFGAIEPLEPSLLGKEMPRSAETLEVAANVIERFLRAWLLRDALAQSQLRVAPPAPEGVLGAWEWVEASDARVTVADFQRLALTDGVAAIRSYCERIACAQLVDPETFRRIAPWLTYQEPALAAQAFDFARLRADVFPHSARAQYALALAAHDRNETALFEEASARTLQLLPTDADPTLDAPTRERMREEIARRSP